MDKICPVCGFFGLFEPPYDLRGEGSYEICPSCGFQFGLDDYPNKSEAVALWREDWVSRGRPWYSRVRRPPEDWNPEGSPSPDDSEL